MSTVKFNLQEELEELQAKIFLETKRKFSKKELLELVFQIGAKNYTQIINEVKKESKPVTDELIQEILSLSEDLGKGSETLSLNVDKIAYSPNSTHLI